jgi:hypothetical protein
MFELRKAFFAVHESKSIQDIQKQLTRTLLAQVGFEFEVIKNDKIEYGQILVEK